MGFDIWGLDGVFSFGLPLRSSGYVFGFLAIAVLVILARQGRKEHPRGVARFSGRRAILLAALVVSAPLVSGLFWIRIPTAGSLVVPGLPSGPIGPVIALLGALPWLLAAGLLGTWEAMLVGIIAGLARGGWQTHSLLTPLHIAVQAGLVSWLLRRDYSDWVGRAARNPLVAGLVGGATFGLLRSLEHFVYSGQGTFDGLDFSLALLGPTLLASISEAGIAGLLALGVRWRWNKHWIQPTHLVTGPYRRSMAARYVMVFLLLGTVASLIVLEGDWILAKAAAEEMLSTQMSQTATQAGEGIPYFIQTGRSQVRSISAELAPTIASGNITTHALADSKRRMPFFATLDFIDLEGQLVSSIQDDGSPIPYDSLAVENALSLALSGIPQEIILPPESNGTAAQMGFLSPVLSATDDSTIGVLAGWTTLDTNPLLQPVVQHLSLVSPGEAFVVDARGVVIIHRDPARLMTWEELAIGESGEVFRSPAPDGTLRSVYVYEVEGYPWRVVVTTPQRVVNSLAVRIAARLFAVMAVVGILLALAVYLTSRRLTLPLREMASAAEAIAAGKLAKPVGGSGDDEVGRLAASFERMRISLKSRLDDMGLLLDVNQHLASSFELKHALPPILAGIHELCSADLVRLLLLPPAEDTSGRAESYQAGTDPGNWASIDEQVISLCLQGGQFVLDNPSRASAVLELGGLKVVMATILGIPIQSKEALIGVIWVAHTKPHTYSIAELDLLAIIARQLEASMTNVRLYQLAEQERMRLGAVLQATPDAVIVTDGSGNISLANPAAEVVLRGRAQEALGKPVEDWLTSPEVAGLLLQPGTEVRSAEVHVSDDRVMFASASDVHAGKDVPMGRVCVLWDITHYKKLDLLKSEFVATVSHDLRNPLTMMHGYARMLRAAGGMSEQQMELVGKIQDSVERMTHMVDHLLDQGRIDAGFGLNLESLRIEDLIKEAIETLRPQAENKQIELKLELQEAMEPIEADAVLLRQAIGNLVENAIKFTQQQGHVHIHASQDGERQVVCVKDDGIGIAPSDLARIFEKFYRGSEKEREQVGGPGLGLSIAKSIAERHGGKLVAESQLGKGSSFTLDIPIQANGTLGT